MANNIHFEARRRQMFLDRVCQAKKDMSLSQESGPVTTRDDCNKPERIMCTDQGQFYQTRGRNDVVFEKVIHDPNFYYRATTERGLQPPLHVNDIYNVIYPGATVAAENRTEEEDETTGQRQRLQKIRQKTPQPRPCPKTLTGVKRDRVYKILHPHTEY